MRSPGTSARNHALKTALETRKRVVLASIRQDLRAAADTEKSGEVGDSADAVGAMCEDDLRFSLLPMKTELLEHIEVALRMLEEGRYGECRRCRRLIPESRLSAMPFAVRCRQCEEAREHAIPAAPAWRSAESA